MKYYSTLYVGMDVHRDSFTLAHYALDMKQPTGIVRTDNDYRRIVAYVHHLREKYGQETRIVCKRQTPFLTLHPSGALIGSNIATCSAEPMSSFGASRINQAR